MECDSPIDERAVPVGNSWTDSAWSTNAATQVVIVEAKGGGECRLNGPWTDPEKGNIGRLLEAVGIVAEEEIDLIARGLYARGGFSKPGFRAVIVAVAPKKSDDLRQTSPETIQLCFGDCR